ncbi:antibiotic biosynthesis monooxygenase [Citrobacter sp. JGM124]|uniref:putative quinol monooxygenase n=1 Tax=Citrobacter sp. JGM124 TaxID=2799789 RepID=UPI001BA764AB|nr:antibiotic biosynthesis monooxygenase [Citrobacter sp. JGM124]MBS0847363.1 antibiotic biosynthesis monooxygenase [Citrobacter sp. JGM124]
MKTPGHFITAKVLIDPQWSVAEGRQALDDYCQAMRQESGCTLALALQDNSQPRRFILWERYENQEAYQQHFTRSHTAAFIKAGWVSLVDVVETTLPAKD